MADADVTLAALASPIPLHFPEINHLSGRELVSS